MDLGKMTRNPLEQTNNRLAEVEQELLEIGNEESAKATLIPGEGEFDHEAWLEAERQELYEQRDEAYQTGTVNGNGAY